MDHDMERVNWKGGMMKEVEKAMKQNIKRYKKPALTRHDKLTSIISGLPTSGSGDVVQKRK